MPYLIVFLFLSFSSSLWASSCPATGNWLQVLGSGGPEVQDKRASSSYLIWVDGKAKILIDAGGGSALRFGESDAKVATLDAVLFSHLHVDHSADFPALIKSSFFENRTTDLPVFGPEGNKLLPATSDFITRLFSENGAWPYLNHFLPGQRHFSYELQANNVDYQSDTIQHVFSNDLFKLSAIRVHHGPLPSLAWRVDITKGGSVTFTGDMSGEFGLLPTLAQDSDILVAHHAIPENAQGVARFLHMPPSIIGSLAKQSKVKKLVLSHRMLRSLDKTTETKIIISKLYSAEIIFSNDLDCFKI